MVVYVFVCVCICSMCESCEFVFVCIICACVMCVRHCATVDGESQIQNFCVCILVLNTDRIDIF